jgi:vancomycin resistance protein YoaR
MPYGEDATVSWGGPDFKFTNNTDYPIKLTVVYSGGQVTATVYGTNLTGKYVEVTNEVLSTTSYETVYQDTTELAAGVTQVKTTGYNGMKVKVYRNVYAADGTLISSTLESNNTYATRNKVILRGVSG